MRVRSEESNALCNVLETYRQRHCATVLHVSTGVTLADSLDGAREMRAVRDDTGQVIGEGHRQVAYCECGAQLVGDSRLALFEAAERHVAHHHPELLGALELDVVMQMAEDVGGLDAQRRPGA